ncbi:adhesion G protein-coupled receptor L3-like [Patella vulgata]|uniref:adhesion G protein-coupled receptor L3-like n=1 Tax=Patella vulgata TaxID=6465 RepID=UPI00217FBC95|nr:adhesion G protein-coupled receptor L3-like [Patella vulgata]
MVDPDRIQQPMIMLERKILQMKGIPVHMTSSVKYLSPCRELMNIVWKINCTVLFREPVDINRFEDSLLTEVPQLGKTGNESVSFEVSFTYQCKNDVGSLIVNSDSSKPCTWYNTGMVTKENFKNEDLSVINRAHLILYRKIYTCPRMIIHHSEVTISADRTSLMIHVNNKTLGIFEFDFAEEGGYFICVEDYVGVETFRGTSSECGEIKLDKSLSKPKPKYSPLGLLSGICTSCSLFFLFITFLVFCLLKKHCTSIGQSIMALTVTLLIAQTLFEFGAEQTEIKWVCETLGILIHHFWLSATFWMNVCTIILFYNLSYPIESRIISKRKFVLSSILYTWGCPMMIVMVVILTSQLQFGNLGYGGSSCYITTPTSRRFAFALPVGVLVLLNVILFCYTFTNLRRDKKLQSNQENQISMFACLKLSVITGLTWIFSFIYEATGYETFHYLFTVLFGAQGVILFLAFVCNRRVYGELKGKIYDKCENRVYEGKGHSTIGHAMTDEGIGPPRINTISNPENEPIEEHI